MAREKLNFNLEKTLLKKGFKSPAGIDEAGRGPLAGPVVASAVVVKDFKKARVALPKVMADSKRLSPRKREEIYRIVKKSDNFSFGIGIVSEKIIDRINILQATKLAMIRALEDLGKRGESDYLILDGNFSISSLVPQVSVVKGDEKVLSCALASIMAKVTRDHIMLRQHRRYPQYGFDRHKGYATLNHCHAILKYGMLPLHRSSFVFNALHSYLRKV